MNPMPVAKMMVLNFYLDFVARYVALSEAYIASLGGNGYEMQSWKERGVQPLRGWMVERKKHDNRKLIRSFPYRLCNSLRHLAGTVAATQENSRIDAFHLDLCGTFAPSTADFAPVLTLLGRKASIGRCFAVTVAEERRNLDLENHRAIRERADVLFGAAALRRFEEHIRQEHAIVGSDAGVKREIGVLLHVAELLQGINRFPAPDHMERVAYLSDMISEKSFHMRMYLFHLGTEVVSKKERPRRLLDLWSASPLWEYGDEQFRRVMLPQGEKKMPVDYPNLCALVAAVSDSEAANEFDRLLKRLAATEKVTAPPPEVRDWLAKFVTTNGETSLPVAVAPKAPLPVSRRKTDKAEAGFSTIDAQLEMLRAAAIGDKELVNAKEVVARRLGIIRKHDWRRTCGALYARTQGKFRASFIKRVVAEKGGEILAELADIYSQLMKSPVSVDELQSEA